MRSLGDAIDLLFSNASEGKPVDWAPAEARVLAFAAKYPQSPDPAQAVRDFMYAFEMAHTPAECAQAWRTFAEGPDREVADLAGQKVSVMGKLAGGPVELAFTAIDGRRVDLNALRGKVVLLDFWATWCPPCRAEIPNVKKVYAAYRDKGFEIVGVSCDVAPDPANSAAWERVAKTGAEVLDFTRKNGMPWPQEYEGKKHNEGGNALASRFAVTGIPAGFLLDQNGRVVAMNVLGPRLEAEIKRLIGP